MILSLIGAHIGTSSTVAAQLPASLAHSTAVLECACLWGMTNDVIKCLKTLIASQSDDKYLQAANILNGLVVCELMCVVS